jgi:hypothetical protein
MCEPMTLALVAAGITAAGSVVGGINSNNAAKFQARVAEQNAILDREASRDSLERGKKEELRQYRINAARLGEQRAAMGANGVEVDFGNNAALQADTIRFGQEDAQIIRENANREAHGFQISAWNQDQAAKGARAQGKAALIGGIFDAAGTLVSAGSQYKKGQATQGGGSNFSSGGGSSFSSNKTANSFGGKGF